MDPNGQQIPVGVLPSFRTRSPPRSPQRGMSPSRRPQQPQQQAPKFQLERSEVDGGRSASSAAALQAKLAKQLGIR